MNSHKETTRQSWGSRLRGAFGGVLVGLLCLGLAAWFLFWNEGRAVKRYRALQEGAGIVESVNSATVVPANEGKLIHLTGTAETSEQLTDSSFNQSATALRLERKVEMYQWKESTTTTEEKQLGGGTETTTEYSYHKDWSEDLIDSSRFKVSDGHQNPGHFPFRSQTFTARDVRLGAFRLPEAQVNRIDAWEPLAVRMENLPGQMRWNARAYEGGIFLGRNPSSPDIGDLRVQFRSVPATPVSVVARQVSSSLEPYTTANGELLLLQLGTRSAESMFETAESANRTTTWIFRVLGFLVVFFGFSRIFKPLSVMGDVIPALGNALETGTKGISFFFALGTSGLIIAVAWLFYRPFIALLLLAVVVLAVVGIIRLFRKSRVAAQPPAPPPHPPAA